MYFTIVEVQERMSSTSCTADIKNLKFFKARMLRCFFELPKKCKTIGLVGLALISAYP